METLVKSHELFYMRARGEVRPKQDIEHEIHAIILAR